MDILKDLNPVQKDAVTSLEGPLLILAGAGSGKTRVLTNRVTYLIKEKNISPAEILAITFTNKAAEEMRARIYSLIGKRAKNIWILTFHSTCARILRKEITRLNYKKNFVIYDSDDSKKLILNVLRELNFDTKKFMPATIRQSISLAKNELVDFEEYEKNADNYYEKVVANVYRIYQQKLLENNAVDFDDLLVLTVRIFQLFPEVLESYQERFRYILIDEYQDTNHVQYMLVSLLAKKYKNICVVGDDDQSVYGWRGADVRNILQFENDFPETKVIKLEQNYRSTKVILEAANYVISNNRGRKIKTLWTKNARGEAVTIFKAEDEHGESYFIASEIERLTNLEKRKHHDFAVFYRTHAQSRIIEESFLRFGIPYKIVGGLKFYERQEIKDILAYLNILINPTDSVSIKRIINVPRRKIGKTSLGYIDLYAHENGVSFYRALQEAEKNPFLSKRALKEILSFLDLIEELRLQYKGEDLALFVQNVIEKSGYLKALKETRTLQAETRIENLQEFVSVVNEFSQQQPDTGLEEFLERISLITDIDTYNEWEEAVTLMTLHNAKGLEFPVVFITGLEEGIFPHVRSMQNENELEEERRLCYVGITRAKERIYLTSAISRNLWGGRSYYPSSRFLREIPEELIQKTDIEEEIIPEAQVIEKIFSIGDRVKHKIFGEGKVLSVKESNQVVVFFDGLGEKTLLVDYAPMEKI